MNRYSFEKKNYASARFLWLIPIILATWLGRDQEDCSSMPAQGNSLRDPILKKTQKKTGRVAQVAECLPCKHET
jgi:hypothetical protein